jgi:SAM-dependent methyltransferase
LYTPKELYQFYQKMYLQGQSRNPAEKIYNHLRVRVISELNRIWNGRILIVGCGLNEDLAILHKCESGFAFDLSFEAVHKIRNIDQNIFTADVLNIPCEDDTFDLIICSEVLEHVPNINSAIIEMHRVLRRGGKLIVSTPNWLSWFGLARWLGEKITHNPIHSSGQPYDDWKTLSRLRRELTPYFRVIAHRGIWYLPPLHYHGKGIPSWLMRTIYYFFSPFEFCLSRILPSLGHLIVLQGVAKK